MGCGRLGRRRREGRRDSRGGLSALLLCQFCEVKVRRGFLKMTYAART